MLKDKEQRELILKDEAKKFIDLMDKVDKEKPDIKDLREIESVISKNPGVWRVGEGFAGSLLRQFLDKSNPSKSNQLILRAEAMDIKEKLGYGVANQLERLIIDQILLCWAGVNWAEGQMSSYVGQGSFSMIVIKHWQDTLSKYQKRYLKTIETLAKVRKLNINIQFNIATNGGKQLNVGSMPDKGK